ncbi:GGDEF domain-containing protein [Clostridium sp. JN-9]|uniref:GGDEF domain-containing protein n=1 Tax=Clostridium sp. JN-9 TaxID=2507159 RepID=UPI000FFE1FE6|nr:GGDEF domain-containing protein [Clostridium sp. JN-9]QAT40790.1 GGDEF domain-containing protein [Clostridium sp. JN-9]
MGGIMGYDENDKETLINLLKTKDNIISELKNKIDELTYFADFDCMTGVYNRRYGLKLLHNFIETSRHEEKIHTTVSFIDVDKLKRVNDNYGHDEGDKLLIVISDVLKKSVRKDDIVFRLGGDEFIIIFPHTSLKQAKKIEKRIWDNIEEVNNSNKFKFKLQISSGFCEFSSSDANSIEELIKKADSNMYKQKNERAFL